MIKTALISVYNKEGIVEFARELVKLGVQIYSTGGTYTLLRGEGIPANSIEEVTGFPEILGGRVKTLHPKVFGGILADRDVDEHLASLNQLGIGAIDLVVVNLYPFAETISKKDVTLNDAIEQIDIGGVSLMRAAAKNFRHVSVLTKPAQYLEYLDELLPNKKISEKTARKLSAEAFRITSAYDKLISDYLGAEGSQAGIEDFASKLFGSVNISPLRYGENPHQKAVLVKNEFDMMFEVIHGKEISYNNMLDLSSACDLVNDLSGFGTACVIVKHGNPCGVAVADNTAEAFERALKTDTISPFGGIVAFNRKLDFNTCAEVDKLFTEILIAPDFDEDALELLKKKKNRRIVKTKILDENFEIRSVRGGILVQERDSQNTKADDLNFVSALSANDEVKRDMLFAETVAKHVKSNAIVFVKDLRTLGIGAGQPSRVDSTRLAVSKARQFGLDLNESIVASDAFFPFADGIREIAESGARHVVQPGGSVRDEEVIREADKLGLTMAFTGVRHFKH